jgi:hypothetical protein
MKRFVVKQYALDGFVVASNEYTSEKGARKRADFLRSCFPYARIEIVARALNANEQAQVWEIPIRA